MADICIYSVSPNGCGHFDIIVNADGEHIVLHTTLEEILSTQLDDHDLQRFLLHQIKRIVQRNPSITTLAQLLNRTIVGEEGTNLKITTLFAKDVTRTNIGTNYVNVLNGANGERMFVDFTGATEYRILCNFNLVGTGVHNFRVSDQQPPNGNLWVSPDQSGAGEKEVDSGWQPIPQALLDDPLRWVIVQAKSTVGADDPVYRRCLIATR